MAKLVIVVDIDINPSLEDPEEVGEQLIVDEIENPAMKGEYIEPTFMEAYWGDDG